jgi:hypothetical protein
MNLRIELVPRSSWGNNVRSMITAMEWDIVRHECYRRANYSCEICGSATGKLHCHEVFSYDPPDNQVLTDLRALCERCHEVKHYGRATIVKREKEAKDWLMQVNGWNEHQVEEEIHEAFLEWHHRNRIQWRLDISYLHKFMKGIP